MAFRFEDDITTEAPVGFLDLQGLKIVTKEDLEGALRKIPDLKLRKEKVVDEENVVTRGKTIPPYPFEDPVPDGMRGVKVREISQVDIDWKMLTLDRPKNKSDEDLFSRFIEVDKLKIATLSVENPRALYGGRSLVSMLPTAPKRTKPRRRRKIAKPKPISSTTGETDMKDGSNSDDNDDTLFDAAENEEEQPVVRFSYEYYIRHLEDKDDNDAGDMGDLADGKEQNEPGTPEKTASGGKGGKKTKKKKNEEPAPTTNATVSQNGVDKDKATTEVVEHKVTFEQTKTPEAKPKSSNEKIKSSEVKPKSKATSKQSVKTTTQKVPSKPTSSKTAGKEVIKNTAKTSKVKKAKKTGETKKKA